MNYYPFHIGDYVKDTAHLTWMEDMAYRRLLDLTYSSEKPLPADERQLFRLTRASGEPEREAIRTVLPEFFELTDEGWINGRAVTELEAMRDKQQKQRDKANAMWERRRAASGTSHVPAHGNASALPQHVPDDAVASVVDAVAMPPTPTPTPTPTPKNKNSGIRASRKCPETFEVTEVMVDWAGETGISVNLKAETDKFRDHTFKNPITDWSASWRNWMRNAQDRAGSSSRVPTGETAYQRTMRERIQQVAPRLAAKPPSSNPIDFFEMEATDVTPRRLG